jgi:HSP20 family molecular chaperone IbpA
MYVTLIILFSFLFWAVSSFGQKKTPPKNKLDTLQKRMQLREEMHRRMMNKLINGIGNDEDLFKDLEQMMNESFQDAFTDMESFESFSFSGGIGSEAQYKTEWTESSQGRTLTITPTRPDQKLDLNVQNNMVTIKGKSENSEFSGSFNVPNDCDSSKVKMSQKDGKIVMEFPYKVAKKIVSPQNPPIKDERIPIKPSENDVTI